MLWEGLALKTQLQNSWIMYTKLFGAPDHSRGVHYVCSAEVKDVRPEDEFILLWLLWPLPVFPACPPRSPLGSAPSPGT